MTTLTMIKLLFVLCIYIEIIVSEGPYMSQMLYAGQSAREIVTFFSDF